MTEPHSHRPYWLRQPSWTSVIERFKDNHLQWGKRKLAVLLQR